MPMAEELEKSSQPAEMVFKKMELYAIHTVEKATMEWGLFVGSTAQRDSQILELIASSPLHTAEVLATLSGMRTSVTVKTLKVVRNGELFGIQSARLTSITLPAVFVHLIALLDLLISEFHAKKILMVEVLERFLDVHMDLKCQEHFATHHAHKDIMEMDQFVGKIVQLENTLVEHFAQTPLINAQVVLKTSFRTCLWLLLKSL